MADQETSWMTPDRINMLDDVAMDKLASAVAQAMRSQNPPHEAHWDRIVTYVLAGLTIVSLIFTFGVNWSRIASNERRLDVAEKRLDLSDMAISSLREQNSASSVAIQSQLGEIKSQLGEIRGALSRK